MTEQRTKRICRTITMLISAVSFLLPETAGAQKNIKVALALSKDVPGIDFINGMYEVFKSDVETRTSDRNDHRSQMLCGIKNCARQPNVGFLRSCGH